MIIFAYVVFTVLTQACSFNVLTGSCSSRFLYRVSGVMIFALKGVSQCWRTGSSSNRNMFFNVPGQRE